MIKILISLILLILPVCVVSADSSLNAGFVSGIWYSDTKFFAGDDIRIYSALQNRSGYDIQGEVSFYVDNELIDTTEFSALSDRLIETWSDWKAIDGDHVVKVEISHIERLEVGSFPEIVNVSSNNYLEDSVFVDIDTDGDGQGDTDDDDDDNDGLSDLEEGQIGSDPKKVDTDEDGINDGDDPDPLVPLSEDNDIATDTSSEDIFMEVAQDTISEIVDTIDRFVDSQAEQVIAKKEEISREIIQAQIHQPVPSPGGGGDSPIKKKAKKVLGDVVGRIMSRGSNLKQVDTNDDGKVDLLDFNALMVYWKGSFRNKVDFNDDGKTDLLDFNLLMIHWTG